MAALFVSASDFLRKPYKIPNQEESNEFAEWLEDKEEEVLRTLLGNELWEAFRNAVAEDTTTARWVNLKDGDDYEYGGYTFEWQGMNKMLIPYIYSIYVRESFEKITNIGPGVNTVANFTVINPAPTIARAQNVFARLVGGCYNAADSLYGFLLANYEDTYTEWDPIQDWKNPGKENLFDL